MMETTEAQVMDDGDCKEGHKSQMMGTEEAQVTDDGDCRGTGHR